MFLYFLIPSSVLTSFIVVLFKLLLFLRGFSLLDKTHLILFYGIKEPRY